MKKTCNDKSCLLFLTLARVYLGLFAASLIAIILVKLFNAQEMGSLEPNFLWAISNFSFILATPIKWGSASVDVVANICTVSILPTFLFASLISYILYYKKLATTKCEQVDCKCECENSCDNKSCDNKEKPEMMILETPIVEERVIVKSSDLMASIDEEVEEEIIEEPIVKEEKPKSETKISEEVAPVVIAKTRVKSQSRRSTKKHYPQIHKGELLEELYASEELKEMTKVDIKTVFEKTFIVFGKHLVNEREVLVYKFGKFELVDVKERESMNPLTKEKVIVPAHKTAKFKASKALKEKMNK
ncbi:HU family DNA-binding protein [Mycoplasma cottewii]|uniref:HU family DNA-binding protein n=1 Tax=Mycoplasma cottewii TaxID=51364 RepID=A0ABY5TWE3_9MOLU|nr:HU family DNA-binding protein [Mycoplasma cottewii]UWD35008.1 HU family DNA-binding protein [Mycoplasma cottewii]